MEGGEVNVVQRTKEFMAYTGILYMANRVEVAMVILLQASCGAAHAW